MYRHWFINFDKCNNRDNYVRILCNIFQFFCKSKTVLKNESTLKMKKKKTTQKTMKKI